MDHLTCKQVAQCWNIRAEKASQAKEPTFRKMAQAMLMFPAETMRELGDYVERERQQESKRNGVLS